MNTPKLADVTLEQMPLPLSQSLCFSFTICYSFHSPSWKAFNIEETKRLWFQSVFDIMWQYLVFTLQWQSVTKKLVETQSSIQKQRSTSTKRLTARSLFSLAHDGWLSDGPDCALPRPGALSNFDFQVSSWLNIVIHCSALGFPCSGSAPPSNSVYFGVSILN